MNREYEWDEYYKFFSYFCSEAIRDECHPRIMQHKTRSTKAIVLVHGLTDSPFYMAAIGNYFHNILGYDVYMPLLHCHGLKYPNGMENVKLEEWKKNVAFAVEVASRSAKSVSIGGLSTGGTLSFYTATENDQINGQLYLFSAALDLSGGYKGWFGEVQERFARSIFMKILDKVENQNLIGDNPYRYSKMDKDGARELALLIKETDHLLRRYTRENPYPIRTFCAHSYADTTASIDGVKLLQQKTNAEHFTSCFFEKKAGIGHASLVLRVPIHSKKGNKLLEAENPAFGHMMNKIGIFENSNNFLS